MQQAYLEQLGQLCPDVLIAQGLIVAFTRLVRERDDVALSPWLAAAAAGGLPELVEFATGIVRDRAAVAAAAERAEHRACPRQAEKSATRLTNPGSTALISALLALPFVTLLMLLMLNIELPLGLLAPF